MSIIYIFSLSSAVGDRGRKSNYFYGSAKTILSTFLSGLRNRLYHSKIQVLSVKPGFVEIKMTKGMMLPKKLLSQPDEVAMDIYSSQIKGKNIIYTKSLWFFIMLIIK